jgi:hypothetical protein
MDFGFLWRKKGTTSNMVVEEIYSLSYQKDKFIAADIISTYVKILTDVVDRTHGLKDKTYKVLWDNCLYGEVREGLISLVAAAMATCTDLYLVYSPSTDVIRQATQDEKNKIIEDYKNKSPNPRGWIISFKDYYKTNMYKIYSELEYCAINSFNTIMNLSKAVQIKIDGLRKSVSALDASEAVSQAQEVASALRSGNDVLLDSKDDITNSSPNITPTKESVIFISGKKANILGMPLSYVNGELQSGIGSSGDSDTRAIERGLKQYYHSIMEPIFSSIFKNETEFRENDFREITSKLETLKAFDLVGNEILSLETKREIACKMFDVDFEEELERLGSEENTEPQNKGIIET